MQRTREPSSVQGQQVASAGFSGANAETRAAVQAWLKAQEAALGSQQKQLQVLHDSLSLRQEELHSRELCALPESQHFSCTVTAV